MLLTDSFASRIASYENTAECNDRIHQEFTQLVQTIPFLKEHRKYIEDNDLGFGDAAFHYMWYLLIQHVAKTFPCPKVLEIGVFKGQVISLWSLIAAQQQLEISRAGISPLKGNPLPESRWSRRWNSLINLRFRRDLASGNFYPEENYRSIIADLFNTFQLDVSQVRLIEGYSNDPSILKTIENETFSLIYIDGDHTYEGVMADIQNYGRLVEPNGFLVMDDASYYLPGNAFWKGHETVSRACECIPSCGFVNVLNVGHNRIYQRIG